jgi:hypothetical protein
MHALSAEIFDARGDGEEDGGRRGRRGQAEGETELPVEVPAAEGGIVAVGEAEARLGQPVAESPQHAGLAGTGLAGEEDGGVLVDGFLELVHDGLLRRGQPQIGVSDLLGEGDVIGAEMCEIRGGHDEDSELGLRPTAVSRRTLRGSKVMDTGPPRSCKAASGASPAARPSGSRRTGRRTAVPRTTTRRGAPPATIGPRCCRSRRPCPTIPSLSPAGRPGRPQQGDVAGRTASTSGTTVTQALTSTPLALIVVLAPPTWLPFIQVRSTTRRAGATAPWSPIFLDQRRADAPLSPPGVHRPSPRAPAPPPRWRSRPPGADHHLDRSRRSLEVLSRGGTSLCPVTALEK